MDMTVWIIVVCLGFLTQYVLSFGDRSVQYIGPSILSEGDPFTLSCVTPFNDSSTWTVNSSLVITDENLLGYELMERRLYSFYREMILRTASAQLFHSGEYRCNGYSRDFHMLKVVEDAEAATEGAEVTDSPLNKHTKRDGGDRYPVRYLYEQDLNYQFTCEVEDTDYPVLWYKDLHLIDSYTYPNIERYGNHLIIHQAQTEDVGEYACRLDATYQPGKRDIVSRYLLISPAEIVDISERQNVIRGRSMTLYCRATGYPLPRLTWYIGNLNAYILKETDLRISVYSKREKFSNAYLTLRNMSHYDRNLYTCRAENGIKHENGKRFHEKSLTVYVRDNIIEPNEDEPGLGKVLTPGETLILQCKTEECPYCSIVWFKEGVQLQSTDDESMLVDDENNSLIIHSPTVNDTGLYECAVNREQLNVDLRATIRVRTCDEFLSEGFTIENVCEIPLIEATASRVEVVVLELLFLVLFTSLWTRMMV